MKASGPILPMALKFLILGFDPLFPKRLILDYPDVSLGGSRADLTIGFFCEPPELASLPSASQRTAR